MNALYATTKQGTIGELIVQLRFLEYDVQAAPPIKDSGNDLIAIKGAAFRAIQVRCSMSGKISKPKKKISYHILAVVKLPKENGRFVTSKAEVYLFSRGEVDGISGNVSKYPDNLLDEDLVAAFFAPA
jgi:hypothetical protein